MNNLNFNNRSNQSYNFSSSNKRRLPTLDNDFKSSGSKRTYKLVKPIISQNAKNLSQNHEIESKTHTSVFRNEREAHVNYTPRPIKRTIRKRYVVKNQSKFNSQSKPRHDISLSEPKISISDIDTSKSLKLGKFYFGVGLANITFNQLLSVSIKNGLRSIESFIILDPSAKPGTLASLTLLVRLVISRNTLVAQYIYACKSTINRGFNYLKSTLAHFTSPTPKESWRKFLPLKGGAKNEKSTNSKKKSPKDNDRTNTRSRRTVSGDTGRSTRWKIKSEHNVPQPIVQLPNVPPSSGTPGKITLRSIKSKSTSRKNTQNNNVEIDNDQLKHRAKNTAKRYQPKVTTISGSTDTSNHGRRNFFPLGLDAPENFTLNLRFSDGPIVNEITHFNLFLFIIHHYLLSVVPDITVQNISDILFYFNLHKAYRKMLLSEDFDTLTKSIANYESAYQVSIPTLELKSNSKIAKYRQYFINPYILTTLDYLSDSDVLPRLDTYEEYSRDFEVVNVSEILTDTLKNPKEYKLKVAPLLHEPLPPMSTDPPSLTPRLPPPAPPLPPSGSLALMVPPPSLGPVPSGPGSGPGHTPPPPAPVGPPVLPVTFYNYLDLNGDMSYVTSGFWNLKFRYKILASLLGITQIAATIFSWFQLPSVGLYQRKIFDEWEYTRPVALKEIGPNPMISDHIIDEFDLPLKLVKLPIRITLQLFCRLHYKYLYLYLIEIASIIAIYYLHKNMKKRLTSRINLLWSQLTYYYQPLPGDLRNDNSQRVDMKHNPCQLGILPITCTSSNWSILDCFYESALYPPRQNLHFNPEILAQLTSSVHDDYLMDDDSLRQKLMYSQKNIHTVNYNRYDFNNVNSNTATLKYNIIQCMKYKNRNVPGYLGNAPLAFA